jgi:ribonuclease VapC
MVIDTSALVAILADEPERAAFNRKIAEAPVRIAPTGSYLESAIVIDARYGEEGLRDLQLLLSTAAIELIPFDAEQALLAKQAYSTYGKGRHSASLNFGDCFAYALAKVTGEPLLFKGNDFSETDLAAA